MSFKDILVHVDDGRNHQVRIELAVALARQHEAHLIGLAGYEPIPILGLSTGSTGSYLDVQTYDLTALQAKVAAAQTRAQILIQLATLAQLAAQG